MLKPWYFIGKASRMLALYDQLEDWIMRDIARRLFAAGKLTATADREIWKLQQMGLHRREIEKKLAKLTGKSRAEIRALLQDAVVASWDDDKSILEKLGQFFSGPLDNPEVRRVMDAEYAKSQGELSNLTRSTMLASQKKLIELLDAAEMRTAAGVQSYDEAVAEILDAYAGEGAKVSYPTGREMSIEAAVRMCVVTSMNQTAAQVTNKYIKEAGTNYVLTSAHYGARVKSKNQPDLAGHDLWQGRVFCIRGSEPGIPNLLESTGYDIDPVTGVGRVVNPLGLHGYNCRHSHQPWDKRLRNPWRDKDGNLLDGNGNIITPEKNREVFENLQKQRAMERKIRQTKRRLLMKQEEINAATDPAFKSKLEGEYAELSERLTAQNREYNEFCRRHNLQPDYARTKAMGFGAKEQMALNKTVKGLPYKDITKEWTPEKDFPSNVEDSPKEVTIKGIKYTVNGHSVKLMFSPKERQVADLISRKSGDSVIMMPRISGSLRHVPASDFQIGHECIPYDFKELKGNSSDAFRNAISPKKDQAHSFIIDVTNYKRNTVEEIERQMRLVFTAGNTAFVDTLVVIWNDEIYKVFKRK